MNKILKKIINKPLRNPKDDPWNFINDAVADCSRFNGTLVYQGKKLYKGMILSHDHADISNIISTIRTNHDESDLTVNKTIAYSPELRHVHFRCPRGMPFADPLDANDRQRKTRTSRHIEGVTQKCCFSLNLAWSRVGNQPAWVVGKNNPCHEGHCARTQKIARPTAEQREMLGAQMVDVNLSAAQVVPSNSVCSMDACVCACYLSMRRRCALGVACANARITLHAFTPVYMDNCVNARR